MFPELLDGDAGLSCLAKLALANTACNRSMP